MDRLQEEELIIFNLFFDQGKWSTVFLLFERERAEKTSKPCDPN